MRTQILKINGVTPDQIGPLHTALNSALATLTCKGGNHLKTYDGGTGPEVPSQILSSQFEQKFGTYTVEIRVPICAEQQGAEGNPGNRFTSRKVIDLIYGILEIFPEKEEFRKA